MADNEDSTDQSQKTEEPTERKLEDARKRGQVIYSREISNWAMLFTATLLIVIPGPGILTDISETLKAFLAQPEAIPADAAGIQGTLQGLFLRIGSIIILPLLALAAAGILASILQTGPLFTMETLKPDLSKISVLKGFGRLFSMRSVVEFLKGIFKLVVVSIAGVTVLLPYFGDVEHFVGQDIDYALFDLKTLFLRMMIAVLSVLFVLAVFDYIFQRLDFLKKMRMSKQEIKDEFKQTEGDPMVKAKLRQLREQKARQRMMQAVPEADVVITNPTHYAVALKYDSKEMNAPMLVAKGADLIAQKIKELAKEHKIPVIENAPLARVLFDSLGLEQIIPPEHYKAVAEIISYVFKLKGKKL